jgi:hypothetical protein
LSKPKPKPKKPKRPELAVSETWFVRLPGGQSLACTEIDELTLHTVVLRMVDELGMNWHGSVGRYELASIKFVEKLP